MKQRPNAPLQTFIGDIYYFSALALIYIAIYKLHAYDVKEIQSGGQNQDFLLSWELKFIVLSSKVYFSKNCKDSIP